VPVPDDAVDEALAVDAPDAAAPPLPDAVADAALAVGAPDIVAPPTPDEVAPLDFEAPLWLQPKRMPARELPTRRRVQFILRGPPGQGTTLKVILSLAE
jgi:hypothetical protein